MELEEFRKDFAEQINIWATADRDFKHAAFVACCIRLLEDAEEVSDFESCYFRGTGSRNRTLAVDGFSFDDADGSVRLFLADFNDSSELATLTQTQAKSFFSRLHAFFEDSISGRLHQDIEESAPAHALAMMLHERASALTRLRCHLLTDAQLSSRVRDWPEGNVAGVPVEYHIWDISRFHRVQQSQTGRDDLSIDFKKLVPEGIPCLASSVEAEQYKAYLCVIPGNVLADIYDLYGSRLLEGNVRSFLSTKGRINKGIRNTLIHEPEMFFAYNNGIAATATEVVIESSASGLRLVEAKDLQIVNGGQTTASLASARRMEKAALERTFVQMKLSVVSPARSGEIIPLISRYANSQNKVSDADFFSNHEFHRRMEEFSRRLWAPAISGAQHETRWFYERARGQYLNETSSMAAADKRRFLSMNPRDQVITKTDLAKYEHAWKRLPHIVSRGAQKNFIAFAETITSEWDKNRDTFNEEYFRLAVSRAILFKATERLVSAQPWYSGGYRANIVAYAVAKLSDMVSERQDGRVLNFGAIWQKQTCSPALERQLASVARAVFDVIVSPPPGVQNVTEWCKKELCWTEVRKIRLQILIDFNEELIEVSEERTRKKNASELQRTDDRIEAQAQVIRLGSAYWTKALQWGRRCRKLSPDEERLVSLAASLRRVPNEKECTKLLQIKAKLELEGFEPVS